MVGTKAAFVKIFSWGICLYNIYDLCLMFMSSRVRYYQLRYYVAEIELRMTQFQGGQSTQLTVND